MESKSKVLTCSKCSKTFKHKQSLSRHKNIHHGTKSFSCEKCNKYFKRKDALKEHCSSCKGPKERLCKICGKQFPFQWNLKCHIEQKHRNKDLLTCKKRSKQYERLGHFKSHSCVSTKNLKQKRKEKECTSINPVEFNIDDESKNNPENETFFDMATVSLINNHFGDDDVTTDLTTMVAPSIDHEILTKHSASSDCVSTKRFKKRVSDPIFIIDKFAIIHRG